MPHYYEFDDQHRILLAIAYGHIDADQFRRLYFDIQSRRDETNPITAILDLTGVTSFNISSKVLRELALHAPIISDPTLRVVVAPTDYLFGMARMFQIIGSETRKQLKIVRTLNEALTLLDAGGAQFHRLDAA